MSANDRELGVGGVVWFGSGRALVFDRQSPDLRLVLRRLRAHESGRWSVLRVRDALCAAFCSILPTPCLLCCAQTSPPLMCGVCERCSGIVGVCWACDLRAPNLTLRVGAMM